jgi:peptidoglycan/xylan/chitin deacetylase (PgdA/CDA1 family)
MLLPRIISRLSAFVILSMLTALHVSALEPAPVAPAGLDSARIPQLICLGFDDNRYADGIKWVTGSLMKGRMNPAAKGNKATFDGTPMRASFFATSDAEQTAAIREAYDMGFEIGNHTKTHQHNLYDLNYADNLQEIGQCSKYLVNKVGMPPSQIYGFRTPFLAYSVDNTSFKVLRELGFLYDCTLDNGTQSTAIQWAKPYFPGTMDKGWMVYTNLVNPGLWQLPHVTYLGPGETTPREKGFDSGIWPRAATGSVLLGYLKSTLDWHYKGNRAPMDLGLHSDYYTSENKSPDVLAFATDFEQRRQALVDFLNYAQTLPDVRVVNMVDFVRWMRNPAALDDRSKNAMYELDDSKVSSNILSKTTATGAGLTANIAGGTLTASGRINSTGLLSAKRHADVVLALPADLEGVKGLRITYTSNFPLRITFSQSDLEASAGSHFWEVPSSPAAAKTLSAPATEIYFEKPRPSVAGLPALDLAKVTKIVLSPMVLDENTAVNFTVTDLSLYGANKLGVGVRATPRGKRAASAGARMTAAGKDRVTLYVSEAGKYAIRFYAPNGRLVKSLAPRRIDHGYNIVILPQPLTEGLYTVRITGDRFSRTQAVYSR